MFCISTRTECWPENIPFRLLYVSINFLLSLAVVCERRETLPASHLLYTGQVAMSSMFAEQQQQQQLLMVIETIYGVPIYVVYKMRVWILHLYNMYLSLINDQILVKIASTDLKGWRLIQNKAVKRLLMVFYHIFFISAASSLISNKANSTLRATVQQ